MATAQTYIDKQALFDLRVLNTYGYTQEAVDVLGAQPGIRGQPRAPYPSTRF